ncbi:hypothetical protein RYX36_003578 [Vicia faba]
MAASSQKSSFVEIGVEQGEKKHKGTPIFMSPESVIDVVYESPVDIWALGCTAVEILTGEAAWNMGYDPDLLDKILVRKEIPLIPGEISEEAKDFLKKCLVRDPSKR